MAKKETLPTTEHNEQVSLFQWWDITQCKKPWASLLFAIPNGGLRNIVTAARLKAEGVKPGIPDLFLAWPAGGLHGLWIELKTPKGRPSRIQKEVLEILRSAGYAAVVAYGWDQAMRYIELYLAEKPLPEKLDKNPQN